LVFKGFVQVQAIARARQLLVNGTAANLNGLVPSITAA
jgi:hypothetical protein